MEINTKNLERTMDNITRWSFFNFPPNIEEFLTYESNVHQEIGSQLANLSALTFSIMEDMEVEKKKKLYQLKVELDKVRTNFDVILSSTFSPSIKTSKILSLHHETLIMLDFLILDRITDFSFGLNSIKLHDDFDERNILLSTSLRKISQLIELRKVTHKVPPSKEFFENLVMEFTGDLSYLESLGIFHEYDELMKPLKGNLKEYYEELHVFFHRTCIGLLADDLKSIYFLEFIELFKKKYPGVEFTKDDLEKAARNLNTLGIIGLTQGQNGNLKSILLIDDSTYQREILELATEKGYTTHEEIIKQLRIPVDKSLEIIEKLEKSGLALAEEYSSGKRIYFPGLHKGEKD